ncbi:MAG: MucBP domain-containing protein, partial [Oscillospiraceae bacterium]|nr:MucBP domain-containing protein [Oscillospiraceae bacterium]
TGDPLTGTLDKDKTVNFYLEPLVNDISVTDKINSTQLIIVTDKTNNTQPIPPQTVTVNYLDQNGNPITDPNVQNLYNGDPYSVTNPGEITIKGITYKVVKTEGDPLIGTLDKDKIVNFYLEPLANEILITDKTNSTQPIPSQTITLNYLDLNDNPIKEPDVKNLYNGDPYSVTNPGEITIKGITYKVVKTEGDPLTGTLDRDKIVNFYLEPLVTEILVTDKINTTQLILPQTVTVNYLDLNDNPIKEPDVQNLFNGDPYSVTNPGEVTINGIAYKVVSTTGDPLIGTLDRDKIVNFYLEPLVTEILVTDKINTTQLIPPQTITEILVTDKINTTQTIPPQPIIEHQVIVNYLDKYGNPIKNSDILESYDLASTDFLTIDGVTYKVRKIENIAGTGNTEKIYNYILSPPQKVTINYYYLNGEPITDPDILKLFNDDEYDVTDFGFLSEVEAFINMEDAIACIAGSNNNLGKELILDGVLYEVVKTTGDPVIGIADTDKVINYYLAPLQTVTVNYLDKNEEPITAPSIQTVYKGDPYDVSNDGKVNIDEVTYKVVKTTGDPVKGIADTDKTINFELAPPQTITVNYLDKKEEPIKEPSVQNVYQGDPYDVSNDMSNDMSNDGKVVIDEVPHTVIKTTGDPVKGIADTDKTINFHLAPPQKETLPLTGEYIWRIKK